MFSILIKNKNTPGIRLKPVQLVHISSRYGTSAILTIVSHLWLKFIFILLFVFNFSFPRNTYRLMYLIHFALISLICYILLKKCLFLIKEFSYSITECFKLAMTKSDDFKTYFIFWLKYLRSNYDFWENFLEFFLTFSINCLVAFYWYYFHDGGSTMWILEEKYFSIETFSNFVTVLK